MNQKNNYFHLILVSCLIIFALLILFYPLLFAKKIFLGGDAAFYFYPVFNFFSRFINSAGGTGFWSSGILSGFPINVSLTGGFFYFLNTVFFRIFTNPFFAYHGVTFLNFFLAGLFSYLFVRNIGLNKTASLLAALTYILSFWLVSYQAILSLTNSYFILPLVLLSLLKIKQGKYKYSLLALIGLAIGWLAANPQFVLFIIMAGFFYALYLDYYQADIEQPFFKKIRTTKILIVVVLASFLIGSVQIIPSNKFSALSARSQGLTYQEAAVGAMGPIDLVSYLLPYFEIPHFSWGDQGILYLGFLPLFFALLAVFNRPDKEKRGQLSFFIFLFAFAFLAAIPYSPIFWLMHLLPGFKYFRVPLRWMYLGTFASAVLAAYGYSFFTDSLKVGKKIDKFFRWLIYLISGMVLIANLLFWTFGKKIISFFKNLFDARFYQKTTQLPLAHYHRLIETYIARLFDNLNIANHKFLIPFAFILLGYCLVKLYSRGKINLAKFRVLVIIIITANFLLVYSGEAKYISQELYLRKPQTVEIINGREKSPTDFRIFSFMPGFSAYQKLAVPHNADSRDLFFFHSAMVAPNLGLVYGLQTIDGYDNIMPRRQSRILAELGSDRATAGNKLTEQDITLEEKINRFLSKTNLLAMQNVKYIISAYPLAADKFKLISITEASRFRVAVYLYQNLDFLPRLYFAKQVRFIGYNEEENFDLLMKPNNDFEKLTFIECLECGGEYPAGQKAEIKIEKYQDGLVELITGTDREQWLIFSESNLPVWRATIDGQDTRIYRANYIYQAVKIPAGEHQVRFQYQGTNKYENSIIKLLY